MTPAILLATLIVVGYAAFYLLMCAAFPFGRCRRPRCTGGRVYSRLFTKAFKLCPRCEGTGRRVRIGRRIYEYLRSEHARGSK